MSQFDYSSNIMQPALDAVVTLNSGTAEPPTTKAFMLWMDTSATPTILKQRNADDTGWEALFTAAKIPFDDGATQINANNVQEAIEKVKVFIDAHAGRTDNPHQVTAIQAGASPLGHTHPEYARLDTVQAWTALQYSTPVELIIAADGNVEWDLEVAHNAKLVLTRDVVLNPINLHDGAYHGLEVVQDATGGHALSFAATVKPRKTGGRLPEVATDANATTIIDVAVYSGVVRA